MPKRSLSDLKPARGGRVESRMPKKQADRFAELIEEFLVLKANGKAPPIEAFRVFLGEEGITVGEETIRRRIREAERGR